MFTGTISTNPFIYGENNNLLIFTNMRNGNIHKRNAPLAGGNIGKQHHQSEF